MHDLQKITNTTVFIITVKQIVQSLRNVKYLKHTIRRIGKIGELLLMRKRLICNNTKNIFSCFSTLSIDIGLIIVSICFIIFM